MTNDNSNTFRVRQKHAKIFSRFSSKSIEDGVQAVIGYRPNGINEVQSYIFSKDRFKNAQEAKLWVRRHNAGLKEHFSAPYINLKYGPVPFYPISEGYLDAVAPAIGLNLTEGGSVPTYDISVVRILESYDCNPSDVVRRAKVRLIKSGESKNGNVYSEACLREAAPLFEGVPVYLNHKDDRGVEDKVGFYSDVHYHNGSIEGVINIFTCEEKAWNMIQAQSQYPNAKICALSINAFGEGKVVQDEGTGLTKRLVTRLTDAVSTDMVDNPSAGGKILNLMESIVRRHKEGESHMENVEPTEEKLDEAFPPKKTSPKEKPPVAPAAKPAAKAAAPAEAPPEAPADPAAEDPNADPAADPNADAETDPTDPNAVPEEEAAPGEDPNAPVAPGEAPPVVDPLALFQKEKEVMMAELHRLMMENEMLKKQLEVLTMAESENVALKTQIAGILLAESISKKLANVTLPNASKNRLAKQFNASGAEQQEGDKPSNWDVLISEETSYVEELKESMKVTPSSPSLGHARTETESVVPVVKPVTTNVTESIRVAESITKGLGV